MGQHSLDWELDLQGVVFREVFQDLLEMPLRLIIDLQRFLPKRETNCQVQLLSSLIEWMYRSVASSNSGQTMLSLLWWHVSRKKRSLVAAASATVLQLPPPRFKSSLVLAVGDPPPSFL